MKSDKGSKAVVDSEKVPEKGAVAPAPAEPFSGAETPHETAPLNSGAAGVVQGVLDSAAAEPTNEREKAMRERWEKQRAHYLSLFSRGIPIALPDVGAMFEQAFAAGENVGLESEAAMQSRESQAHSARSLALHEQSNALQERSTVAIEKLATIAAPAPKIADEADFVDHVMRVANAAALHIVLVTLPKGTKGGETVAAAVASNMSKGAAVEILEKLVQAGSEVGP